MMLHHLFLVIFSVLVSIGVKYPHPILDKEYYQVLAANHTAIRHDDVVFHTHKEALLENVTVVVTGATSGLGLSITQLLYDLGATVVALGRSPSKLTELQNSLGEGALESDGDKVRRFFPIKVNLNDLDSVASAADEVLSKFDKLDYLINNAGIISPIVGGTGLGSSSEQGFDLAFGGKNEFHDSSLLTSISCTSCTDRNESLFNLVNYLSHFLLTEKLLPLMENSTMRGSPRIVQVSSIKHFTSDGHALVPSSAHANPSASESKISLIHNFRSYSETKLAQIYHARALTRDLQRRNPSSSIQVVSICPSWVKTNIGGALGRETVYTLFAFDPNGFGLASYLHAMFHPDVGMKQSENVLNDYITSCSVFCNNRVIDWVGYIFSFDKTGIIRHFLLDAFVYIGMLIQKPFGLVDFQQSSRESYNEENQDALYKWTKDVLTPWLSSK